MSGEALNNTQLMSSVLTAMEDCVRGNARNFPLRSPSHIGQLQFHCGNPPPAADPSTLIFTMFFYTHQNDGQTKRGLLRAPFLFYLLLNDLQRTS